MASKKVAPELVALLDQAATGMGLDRKVVFGCPTYFVQGNMFAGVHGEGIFVRLSSWDRAAFSAHYGESTFEPIRGRRMREYVLVPEVVYHDAAALADWLERGRRYVATLPSKENAERHNR